MSLTWDVLGLGAVAVDDLLYVDQYPVPDSKVPVQAKERHGGGLAGTALVAAARLGAAVAYCGVLGDDELSQYTLEEFKREGIDCTPVMNDPSARPIHSIVIVDRTTGSRSILYSMKDVVEPDPGQIDSELIARCKVLFVDHTVMGAALAATRLARALAIPVVGDVETVSDPRSSELISLIDHLVISQELAWELTGAEEPDAAVPRLAGPDRACCVVTAGEKGCWYSERGRDVQHFPAFRVDVVDTTGCGDVFHGAYAAGIARGESVTRSIEIATAAAGIKATWPGGRAGIPDLNTLDLFLKEHTRGQ